MLLIGHRGCKYPGYNQNTIRAFEKVTEEGVPAIEFDVQLSGDGQLVIVHNLDLEEVSTGKGEVSSTDSDTLKKLYAGDPAQGKDRIPFLEEVFDFFARHEAGTRPAIHMELKGRNTGRPAGELFNEYAAAGKLEATDLLVSSFNWKELEALREVCPTVNIALLDGAIRRNILTAKTGTEAARYFGDIFTYGNEEYMLPRHPSVSENLAIFKEVYRDPAMVKILEQELTACLNGNYYTDELLDRACAMNATSVNLWYHTLTPDFVEKAHKRSLAVFVFTVNKPDEILAMREMNVDGIFTDYFADASRLLTKNQQ